MATTWWRLARVSVGSTLSADHSVDWHAHLSQTIQHNWLIACARPPRYTPDWVVEVRRADRRPSVSPARCILSLSGPRPAPCLGSRLSYPITKPIKPYFFPSYQALPTNTPHQPRQLSLFRFTLDFDNFLASLATNLTSISLTNILQQNKPNVTFA